MKFIKLNWWKLFVQWGITLAGTEILFVLIFFYRESQESNMNWERKMDLLLITPIVISGMFAVLIFLFCFLGFYISRKIFSDKSDDALYPLWDNRSYSTELANTDSIFNYTQEYINGYISGFPAAILYKIKTSKNESSRVIVSFFCY